MSGGPFTGSWRSGPKYESFAGAKKILWYTKWYHRPMNPWKRGATPFSRCPVSNCYITEDKKKLASLRDYDALVFNFFPSNMVRGRKGDLWDLNIPDPKDRSPFQRYVMVMLDPPRRPQQFPHHMFNSFFNWTMTYREDSDFPVPYGTTVEARRRFRNGDTIFRRPERWIPYNSSSPLARSTLYAWPGAIRDAAGRSNLAVWLVSHCETNSAREQFVSKLRRRIQVDIFGKCGEASPCPKSQREGPCDEKLVQGYKFYLSFENNLCQDYVTEKFWNAMRRNVVPVVMGRADYGRIAPPHSHINVEDFPSAEALADYLIHLDQNDEEYLSYFWWKFDYAVAKPGFQPAICNLCARLNAEPSEPDVLEDLEKWWLKCEYNPPWA